MGKTVGRFHLFFRNRFIFAFFILVFCLFSCKEKNNTGTGTSFQTSAIKETAISDDTALSHSEKLRIASLAPALTTILAGLGLADSLVAVDTWSAERADVPVDAVRFDMMNPDAERLALLEPDLIFVSTITQAGTNRDPFKPLSEAGARVEYMATSASIAGIRDDVTRIAELTGTQKAGHELVAQMDTEIDRISAVARSIPESERRTVVFEIAPAPYIYSFGSGVYLNELLETVGAVNALADEKGWISVSAETIVAADPDVILTNVNYLDDSIAEIKARPGWSDMKAVKTGRVFYIDNTTSSQPAPDIVKALNEIAKAVYPEYFK